MEDMEGMEENEKVKDSFNPPRSIVRSGPRTPHIIATFPGKDDGQWYGRIRCADDPGGEQVRAAVEQPL
jgi:hypothetical protein